jgi:CRISPR-associated endonuclease/helicase Cas3
LSSAFDNPPAGRWIAKGASDTTNWQMPAEPRLQWNSITRPADLAAQWLIAIHPQFASYSPDLGLQIGTAGEERTIEYSPVAPLPRYQYEFEPWTTHAERVVRQAQSMTRAHAVGEKRLAELIGTDVAVVWRILEIACALHDAGKLTEEWQRIAWRWQGDKDARLKAAGVRVPERPQVPLAHTAYDPLADREYGREAKYRFPNHAVEGAYAVATSVDRVLVEVLDETQAWFASRAILSAIARHHSPTASKLGLFRIRGDTRTQILQSTRGRCLIYDLAYCQSRLDANKFGSEKLANWIVGEEEIVWSLTMFIVRRLRLLIRVL